MAITHSEMVWNSMEFIPIVELTDQKKTFKFVMMVQDQSYHNLVYTIAIHFNSWYLSLPFIRTIKDKELQIITAEENGNLCFVDRVCCKNDKWSSFCIPTRCTLLTLINTSTGSKRSFSSK